MRAVNSPAPDASFEIRLILKAPNPTCKAAPATPNTLLILAV